jgi:hypothetical protein
MRYMVDVLFMFSYSIVITVFGFSGKVFLTSFV